MADTILKSRVNKSSLCIVDTIKHNNPFITGSHHHSLRTKSRFFNMTDKVFILKTSVSLPPTLFPSAALTPCKFSQDWSVYSGCLLCPGWCFQSCPPSKLTPYVSNSMNSSSNSPLPPQIGWGSSVSTPTVTVLTFIMPETDHWPLIEMWTGNPEGRSTLNALKGWSWSLIV